MLHQEKYVIYGAEIKNIKHALTCSNCSFIIELDWT